MKAIVQERYGPFEALASREIDKPLIGEGEVLVRVHATGVHVGDCFTVTGTPFPVRLATGLFRPRSRVPGFDVAGVVADVGSGVTKFKPGDKVFGVATGAFAEFAKALEAKLALKPASLSFAEAAAIPTSALAALQGLRDAGKLRAGQSVLINGASGGVGSFALQIAKALGADVTAVCSGTNAEMVRLIGADRVIDYTREDFTRGRPYDLIFDNVENRSLDELRRVVAPGGTIVLNSGTGAAGIRMLVRLLRPLILSVFSNTKMRRFVSLPNSSDLLLLATLVDTGKLRPIIDRTYALPDTTAALRHIASGHARGKVVLAISAA